MAGASEGKTIRWRHLTGHHTPHEQNQFCIEWQSSTPKVMNRFMQNLFKENLLIIFYLLSCCWLGRRRLVKFSQKSTKKCNPHSDGKPKKPWVGVTCPRTWWLCFALNWNNTCHFSSAFRALSLTCGFLIYIFSSSSSLWVYIFFDLKFFLLVFVIVFMLYLCNYVN